jgi:hypothetical protein
MPVEDAAELARTRRGVEPLRILLMARRAADACGPGRADAHDAAEPFAPMPIAF